MKKQWMNAAWLLVVLLLAPLAGLGPNRYVTREGRRWSPAKYQLGNTGLCNARAASPPRIEPLCKEPLCAVFSPALS